MAPLPSPHLPPGVYDALLACYQLALGHELPSRLVAVQGLLRLLETEAADRLDAETRDYLTQSADLARRAHALTRELAELGRSVRNPTSPRPVCISEAAREALAEAIQVARWLPVEYHDCFSANTLMVSWPGLVPALVRLFHYLIQVCTASGQRNDLTLRIEVGDQQNVETIAIWVRGDVAAPPAERLARLFDPFAAPPGVTTSELGLFPVRLLATTWGGTVSASAESGLTFTLVLPAEGSATEEGHGRPVAVVPDRGR